MLFARIVMKNLERNNLEEEIRALKEQVKQLIKAFNEHTHITSQTVPSGCGCCFSTETTETQSPEIKVKEEETK